MSPVELKEYHCTVCNKLLCKGILADRDSKLEVKCRGCHTISLFEGPDAEIIKKRSVLIKAGLIPDSERDAE